MKVVILTKDSIISRFTINNLVKENNYFIIIEKKRSWHFLFKKFKCFVKKKGLFNGLFLYFIFLIEIPFILRENKKVNKYLKRNLKKTKYYYPIIKINSVNNPKIIKIIQKIDPKIIIDIGTSIIKKNIINSLNKNQRYLINWHMGITPKYRGCQSEFWAIYNNDLDQIGSTIHCLDQGIDTGKIILQKRVKLQPNEQQFQYDYKFMRYKNILLGIELLNKFLVNVMKNNFKKFKQFSQASCLFSTPRKKEYKKYYRCLKKYV